MDNCKIILVDTGSESNKIMLSDIGKMPNAIQISEIYNLNNKVVNFLFRLHFGFKINKYCDFPLKFLWNRKNVFNQILADDETQYYILLANDVIRKFSNSFLNRLNSKNNFKVYIILLDSYNYLQPYFKRCINKVRENHIYSFQKSDCERFGYNYTYTLYSKVDLPEFNPDNVSDAYFIGAEKNRIDDIYAVYKRLKEFGFSCKFIVIIEQNKYEQYSKKYFGIDFKTKRIAYSEILEDIASTKCIVELCQKGQDGLTMRFYEALFYNKFLITNNPSVITHPFYNSKFMQYFKDPNSIKYFNLCNRVNYYYSGELSPVHLVDDILKKNDSMMGFLK